MSDVLVVLHRIAAGGSIRSVVNGGRPTYFTEDEVRDRLTRADHRLEEDGVEGIIATLSTGLGSSARASDPPS